MPSYYVNLNSGEGRVRRAFNYDDVAKVLVPAASTSSAATDTFEFLQGAGYFALVLNGDYPLIYDTDGLLVGDVIESPVNDYPRFEFLSYKCGVTQQLATLTQDGMLSVNSVTESDTLPEGLNILDNVCFSLSGVTANKVNEVWFLASDGNYVCSDGQLIRVRM